MTRWSMDDVSLELSNQKYRRKPGKHRPKRGGVNCKEQRLRVEKMANIRHDLKANASWDFTGNTIVKIERSLVGT